MEVVDFYVVSMTLLLLHSRVSIQNTNGSYGGSKQSHRVIGTIGITNSPSLTGLATQLRCNCWSRHQEWRQFLNNNSAQCIYSQWIWNRLNKSWSRFQYFFCSPCFVAPIAV